MKKITAIIIPTIMFITSSCEFTETTSVQQKKVASYPVLNMPECWLYDDYLYIGEQHNMALAYILQNIQREDLSIQDLSMPDWGLYISSLMCDYVDLPIEERGDFINSMNGWVHVDPYHYLTANGVTVIDSLMRIIKTNNLVELETDLAGLADMVYTNTSDFYEHEYYGLLSSIAVTHYSSEYWIQYDTDWFNSLLSNTTWEFEVASGGFSWSTVGDDDAWGALQGLAHGIWFGAYLPTAIFLGAATGSAWGAIRQIWEAYLYNCNNNLEEFSDMDSPSFQYLRDKYIQDPGHPYFWDVNYNPSSEDKAGKYYQYVSLFNE